MNGMTWVEAEKRYVQQGKWGLTYYVEKNQKPTGTAAKAIKEYIDAFERLPPLLGKNVLRVDFLTSATWVRTCNPGKTAHMAAAGWPHAVGKRSPIYINYGKTAVNGFYTQRLTVAAHEAGHALDEPTEPHRYSSSGEWKSITKEFGRKIYSINNGYGAPIEVFAGAVARYVGNNLKSISNKAYQYIDDIVKGRR